MFILNFKRFAFGVCFLVSLSTSTVWSMTIDECVELALKNNLSLQKQQLGVELAKKDISDKKSNNFGRLDFVSSYNYYNSPRTLVPLTPAVMASNPAAVSTTRNLFTTGVVYEVPLFTGFSQTRSVDIASLQKEIVQTGLKLSREQLIYNAKTLYVNILSLSAQGRAQKEYLKALSSLYADIQAKVKLGRLARVDLLKAGADLKNAQAVANQIYNNKLILKESLASLLNSDVITDLTEVDISSEKIIAVQNEFSSRINGLARLHKIDLQIKKDTKLIDKAKGVYYPQIAFGTSYGQNYGPNDSTNIYSGDWDHEKIWQVGLTLRWNIFDFGATKSKVHKARLASKQSQLEKTQMILDLKKSLQEAVSKINTAINDYGSAQAEMELTNETEKIEQVRFEKGAADINDILQAKSRNRLAQSKFIDAGYKYKSMTYYLDYLLEQGELK